MLYLRLAISVLVLQQCSARITVEEKRRILKSDKLERRMSRHGGTGHAMQKALTVKISDKDMVVSATTPSTSAAGPALVPLSQKEPLPVAALNSLIPPIVQLPEGRRTAHLRSTISLEASMPILINERHESLVASKNFSVDTPATNRVLDNSDEHEIDNELDSTGQTLRLAEDTFVVKSQPQYKLIYFDARGICEPIRLILHFVNESFVDTRLSKKEWLQMKNQTFFGKIPILEFNGKQLNQFYAISRYLARKYNLIGTDEWDQAKIDEVAEFHRGVINDVAVYLYVLGGFRDGDKNQLRNEVFLPAVEKNFPIYAKLLNESKSGFFGKNLSWVDFAVSEFFTTVDEYEPFVLKKFPKLVTFVKKIHELPEIRRYIRTRNTTPLI